MISGLKPYSEYKESGLTWIGKVPGHWKVRRMKYIAREVDARSTSGMEQLLRVSQYTGVTQRRQADGLEEPDTRANSLVGYKRVHVNDLVINIMLAWNGSMGVSRHEGIVSPAYCVYRFAASFYPWFFHHLLRTPAYKAQIKASSTGVVESRLRLYSDDLGRIEAMIPPADEQVAIVRFLEWANRRLERAIRSKRKLIALLNEQKQAIIHRAVTRGLDPSVAFKPSGIPWLGKLPSHWAVKRLKYWVAINHRTLGEHTSSDFEFDYIDIGSVATGRLATSPLPMRFADAPSRARRLLNEGDTIISTVRTYLKAVVTVGKSSRPLVASTGFAALTPQSETEPRYLGYVAQSEAVTNQITAESVGVAYPGISETRLSNIAVALPPLSEQAVIVRFLDSEIASLMPAISHLEREIKLLHEYRTRLVADVVTGKLDIREAAARLPDEVPLGTDEDGADLGEDLNTVDEEATA